MRKHNQSNGDLRPIHIQRNFTLYAPGSVLVTFGNTKVIVTASVEEKVPPFLRDSGTGWITAEYSMLPSATHTRARREVNSGKPSGRTTEIQRLIGRSLRSVVDMSLLGERSITIDADVIQADGGTRTAAITGGMVALTDAIHTLMANGLLMKNPIREYLAAVSVGIVNGEPMLDLCYEEDSSAEVDMNVVMTESGQFVEVQGTGEKRPYTRDELDALLELASSGISTLIKSAKNAKS